MKTSFATALRTSALVGALALVFIAQGCKKVVDDATLTTNVQQKLASDSALSTESIQVTVAGGVTTLSGQVSNTTARSLAANDASVVPGVKQVVNNLSVADVSSNAMMAMRPSAPEPEPPAPTPARPASTPKATKAKAPAPAPITRETPPPPVQQVAAPVPPPPAAPPTPKFHDVTLPAGSTIPVRLTQALDSGTSQTGDSFSGVIAADVIQNGAVVLAHGSTVNGRVIEAKDATHFKGSSSLSIELVSLTRRGERMTISTEPISQQGKGRGTNTATKAGVGAAAGAILGGIFGGGKGAAIGAGVGGAGGAGINAVTKGQQVQFPSETILRFHTTAPITVRVASE